MNSKKNATEPLSSSGVLGRIAEKVKAEGRDTVYCTDLVDGPGCCESCHDDEDGGWYGMIQCDSEELLGGLKTSLCCSLCNWLDTLRPNSSSAEKIL